MPELKVVRAPRRKPPWTAAGKIERWPEIVEKEMFWVKTHSGLIPATNYRTKSLVDPEDGFALIPGARATVHTHSQGVLAVPSVKDIARLFSDAPSMMHHIANLNSKGKVIGYVSMKAKPQFVAKLAEDSDLRFEVYSARRGFPLFKALVQKGFVWHRITPMPGYTFNEEQGRFVRLRPPFRLKNPKQSQCL